MKKIIAAGVLLLSILSFVSGASYQTIGSSALSGKPTYGVLQSLIDARESLTDNARGVLGEELGKIEFRKYLGQSNLNYIEASRATAPNSRRGGGLFDQYGYFLDDDGLPTKVWINEIKSTISNKSYSDPISRLVKSNDAPMQMSNSEVSRLLRRVNEPYNWSSEILRNGGSFEFSRPGWHSHGYADLGDGIRIYPDPASGKVYVQSNRHVTIQELRQRLNRYIAAHESGIIDPNSGTDRFLTIANENSSEISSYKLGKGTPDKISIEQRVLKKQISNSSYFEAKNSNAVRTAWRDMNPDFYNKHYNSLDPRKMYGTALKELGATPSKERLERHFGLDFEHRRTNITSATSVSDNAVPARSAVADSDIASKKSAVATGRYHTYEIAGSLKSHGRAALFQGGLNLTLQLITQPENINWSGVGFSAGAGALTSAASLLGEYASRGLYRTFGSQLDDLASGIAGGLTRVLGKEVSTNMISRIGKQLIPSAFASLAIVGIDHAAIAYGEMRGTISPALADSLRSRSMTIEAASLAISTGLTWGIFKHPNPTIISLIDIGVGMLLEFIVPMPDEFKPEIIKEDISNNPSLLGEWAIRQFGY